MRVKLFWTDFQNTKKKITRKEAYEKWGEKRIKDRIKQAKADYLEDPNLFLAWPDGLIIEIEIT